MNLPAIRDSLLLLSFIVFDADLSYIAEPLSVPNDAYFYMQHSLHPPSSNPPYPDAHINILPAWDIETGKPNIRIAVIDDPIYWLHSEFFNPYQQPNGCVIADGWNYYTNSSVFNTPLNNFIDNHGTSVAGIIGATRNNTLGIAGIAGGDGFSNPGVRLYSLGVTYGVDGKWSKKVTQAIVKASNSSFIGGYEVHAINMSMGQKKSTFYEKDAIASAYRNLCVFVAARGNLANDLLLYPACYDDKLVISVGASGTDGTYKRENGFGNPSNPSNGTQNYGSNFNHVDLIAPGIQELVLTTNWPTSPLPIHPFSGTSAAAPHVTGVVGLLLSRHHPSQGYPNGLAPEDVEYILKSTATDISGSPPNTTGINFPVGPDPYNGHGRLNAGAALNLINLPEYQILHPTAQVIKSQHLVNTDLVIVFGQDMMYPGWGQIKKFVQYEADLYRVTYTTQQQIPSGYQVVDIWERGSSSYGVSGFPIVFHPNLDVTHIYSVDLTTNPITVQAENYFWHIKKEHGTTQNININFPPFHDVLGKAAYSILLHNPTASAQNSEVNESKLNVYPNPATEKITIELSGIGTDVGNLYVYDMFGRVVDERVITASDQGKITIPVTNLAKGVYLCVVVANNKRHTYRFCRL